METTVMSSSLVVSPGVDGTITEVLTHLVLSVDVVCVFVFSLGSEELKQSGHVFSNRMYREESKSPPPL